MAIGVLALAMDWGLAWWISWTVFAVFEITANAMILCYYKGWTKTFKLCFIVIICAIIVAVAYCVCYYCGWLKYFESYQAIKDLILSAGIWGILIFFLIQFAQVIAAPIPAMATTLAGVAIYGPFLAAVISTIAILIGSYVAFFLGRIFGRKVVVWIAGEEQTQKYCDLLNKKGRYLLILMFIFPVFPDDMLCLIAGITTMTFKFFFFATLFARPLGIFVTAYVGSGHLIPYSGWGLYVWPVLILLLVTAFIISWKYQDKIEKLFVNMFEKWQNKFKKSTTKIRVKHFLCENEGIIKTEKTNFRYVKNSIKIKKRKYLLVKRTSRSTLESQANKKAIKKGTY